MKGYFKLDCGIVDSIIWQAPHDAFRVWVAMLAKCDENGFVRVATPAMARLCFVERERFDEIVELLCRPDSDNKTLDSHGNHLQRVDGGWQVVRYKEYQRGLRKPDNTAAERQRRYRARQAELRGVDRTQEL